VMGGHKHHERHLIRRQRLNHVESADVGHLDVKKYDVRLERFDVLDSRKPVGRFADNLDVAMSAQMNPYGVTCKRFIVDDQGADQSAPGHLRRWIDEGSR